MPGRVFSFFMTHTHTKMSFDQNTFLVNLTAEVHFSFFFNILGIAIKRHHRRPLGPMASRATIESRS